MQSGKFDRMISIEKFSSSGRDAYGQPTKEWTLVANAWAQKRTQSSREIFQADKVENINTEIFIIRYVPGVKTDMRIQHEGNTYNIRGVMEIGRNKELQLVAEHGS